MNLQDYMKQKEAKESTIRGEYPYLELKLSKQGKDRFKSAIGVFEDEPTVLYVLRWKMSGLNFVSDKETLNNHNNLHSEFKKAYVAFVEELRTNNIEFTLNQDSY